MTKRNSEGGSNLRSVLSRLWTKVHDILRQRTFQYPYPVVYVTFHSGDIRYLVSKLSENQTNVKVPPIFREGRPQLFYGTLLARPTVHRLAKRGWVSFADLRLRSLAVKQNAVFTGVGKNDGRVLSRLWAKVYSILGRCRRPLVVVNALDRLFISRFIPKI